MNLIGFLGVCSVANAILSISGKGFMSGCSDIALTFPWAGTEDCQADVCPDRAKCLWKNELFLQVVSGCAHKMALEQGITDEDRTHDVKQFAKNIHILDMSINKNKVLDIYSQVADEWGNWPIVDSDDPRISYDEFPKYVDYSSPLESPVQFRSRFLNASYPTYYHQYEHQKLSMNMGCGILAYWALIFLMRAFVLFSYRYAPFLLKANDNKVTRLMRKYIILPPLLRFHHASPYRIGRYFTFQLPTRVTSLTVVGAVAVNYALMFSKLPGGDTYVVDGILHNGYNHHLGARAAQMVLYKLPIIFLFCGRNNFLLACTGWSMNEFSIFHKWVGRLTFVDTIIHAACQTSWSVGLGLYSMWMRKDGQMRWGVAAICLMAAIFLQSIHWLRRLNYELFKYLHMVLSIVFLVASWKHVVYSYYGRPYMYACWAIWVFDHIVRWARILISGFAKATFVYHGGVLEITIAHSNWWQPLGGNHAFIHVLTKDKFWQSHPFSLMRAIKVGEENKIKIIARAKDGITRDWVESCIKNGGSFECPVLVDGPYGTPRNFKFFEELVFIAGGIGISSPYAYLQNKVRRDAHQTISLYWGIPNEEPLTWFSTELEYLANSGKFTIHIFVGLDPGDNGSIMAPGDQFLNQFNSDSSLGGNEKDPFKTSLQGNVHFYSHQMDVPAVIADHIINAAGPTAFMTCGPADMNDTARLAFVQNFEKSRFLCEHFEEHFSW